MEKEKIMIPPDLMPRVAAGDEEAFEQLYNLTYRALFSFLLSLTKNKDDSRDIMQETYLRVFGSAHLYKDKGNPVAWIMKIAKNLYLMEKRKPVNRLHLSQDYDKLSESIPYDSIGTTERRIFLEQIFKILSDEERHIILLHLVSDLTFKDISDTLGMPLSTVTSKYQRALAKLNKIAK